MLKEKVLVEELYCGCLHTKLCSLNLLAMNKEKEANKNDLKTSLESFIILCFIHLHIF